MSEETLFNLEDNALLFYALGYGRQLHRHLPVALAVGFTHVPLLSRTDRLQSALERRCIPEQYDYRPG